MVSRNDNDLIDGVNDGIYGSREFNNLLFLDMETREERPGYTTQRSRFK